MKHALFSLVLGVFLFSPLAASAGRVDDIQLQLMQLLGRVAAQKAAAAHSSLGCALVASRDWFARGEQFELIWNTVGANEPSNADAVSQWARAGISTVLFDKKPGTYTYKMIFYGKGGAKTTCTTTFTVHA